MLENSERKNIFHSIRSHWWNIQTFFCIFLVIINQSKQKNYNFFTVEFLILKQIIKYSERSSSIFFWVLTSNWLTPSFLSSCQTQSSFEITNFSFTVCYSIEYFGTKKKSGWTHQLNQLYKKFRRIFLLSFCFVQW